MLLLKFCCSYHRVSLSQTASPQCVQCSPPAIRVRCATKQFAFDLSNGCFKPRNSDIQKSKKSHPCHAAQPCFCRCLTTPCHVRIATVNRLGPRWEYLQHTKGLGLATFSGAHHVITNLVSITDLAFRASYTPPALSPLRSHDTQYQQEWQYRWGFLLQDQEVSVQSTAAHSLVLQRHSGTSLCLPIWHVDIYRPVDHLTSLASLT